MAAKELVATLTKVFQEAKNEGLIVNAIGLAPAHHGMVKNRFVLGVSAPSLSGVHKYDKMAIIITLLWSKLTLDERGMIERVRVFDNEEILDDLKYNDFEDYPYEGYDGIQRKLPQLYPVE
ncbi:hypothetical protein SAMN05216327_112186 [Dyadobacter sp. SG02]|uniref:hypothetical protein n=1 Tax=Dyadobacter sp. SG02 TaxID=1855291 RepID=UPI0008B8D6FD|nr:hypothetical protein [Dyadobacter sp. SG02]SEJ54976.1 hypothetical protein SAMN05216327_112186 [Dyadobacter sp. SG02]